MSETPREPESNDERRAKRREAIRRLVAAAAVPAVVATAVGNPRPARAY